MKTPAALPERASRPALRVHTLGRVEVLVDGHPTAWHAQTAEELFFYLLSYPEGRSKDEILEVLWGLDPNPAANNRFRVTLHRVRAALGYPEAILEDHHSYRLAPEVLEASDLYGFYRDIAEARRAGGQGERLKAYRRAIRAYSGDYLPRLATNWVGQAREEHRAAYVRALLEVALVHLGQRDWHPAADFLRRAVYADPYIGENYHQQLMGCLSLLGDRYAAIEHYRRFVKFLRDELGDTPMPETRELAERIKAGEPVCPWGVSGAPSSTEHPSKPTSGVRPRAFSLFRAAANRG